MTKTPIPNITMVYGRHGVTKSQMRTVESSVWCLNKNMHSTSFPSFFPVTGNEVGIFSMITLLTFYVE